MIEREDGYITYTAIYRRKYGKRLIRAYIGDDKAAYEKIVQKLEQRDDIRYLSKSVEHTEVILFD